MMQEDFKAVVIEELVNNCTTKPEAENFRYYPDGFVPQNEKELSLGRDTNLRYHRVEKEALEEIPQGFLCV